MAAVNSKARQPKNRSHSPMQRGERHGLNININSVYPKRKGAAAAVGMPRHGLNRKFMAVINTNARQPKNRSHGPMQKDERHGLNININRFYPKRKGAAAAIDMPRHGLNRKFMAAVNSKARQMKNKSHGPMQGDERHGLNININSIYPIRKGAAAAIGMSHHGLKRKFMAAVNTKARQPKNKSHGQMQRDERHGLNININRIYPKRKGAAAAIGMPRHGLNRKFMAAVNTKARQPKNKSHGQMQRDERHGLNININRVYQKRKGAAAAVGMPRHGLNRKFMAAMNTNTRQPKNRSHGPMQKDEMHSLNININRVYQKRKGAAAAVGMPRHGLNRKFMAAVNTKARQLKNKGHGTMQGNERHGLNIKINSTAECEKPKRKGAAAAIGM